MSHNSYLQGDARSNGVTASLATGGATAARSLPAPPLVLITITVMLGMIMAVIDTSIVNVALDTMAGNLGATTDEIGWVSTGYILSQVIVMPLNGWLTARFGRRNYYVVALVVFTIASFFCGTARSVGELVFYRLIQGFGGGALQPTAQAILMESYPHDKRAGAMAMFGIGAMVGPAIGPVLGGYFIDNYSWPLIFFVNVPIGIVAIIMTMMYIRTPAHVQRDRSPIDIVALGLLTIWLASLQYVLQEGQRLDWFSDDSIVTLTIISVVAMVAFVIRELRDPNPLVNLRIFRWRAFSAGSIIGVTSGFGLYGTALILPLFLQNVLGFTPTDAGLALIPGSIATMFSLLLASRLMRVLDARLVLAIALGIFAWGAWWMSTLNQYAGYWDVFWPRAVQGFALGLLFVPLTTATLSEVPNALMASATGIYTLVRQLGGSLGIAVLLFLQTRFETTAQTGMAASVSLANPAVDNAIQHGMTLQHLYALVVANATVISYNMVLALCGIVFALSIPLVVFMKANRASAAASHVSLE
jgi:MFS transporter, DHA2 family, multidrug resistance protein